MKTLWFCGKNEKDLTTIAELVGEGLITRNKSAEIIVHSEVNEILGSGLKDSKEDKATFADRLGFLGNLLHRNDVFALIVAAETAMSDRKIVKDNYKHYVQVNLDSKDELTDIELKSNNDHTENAKTVIRNLISQNLISEHAEEVYSKEEEEEIRRRLEELGYV